MHDEGQIPIWFFIGIMLTIYGILIAASGAYNFISPPPVDQQVKLFKFHADLWWGLLMTIVGAFYLIRFRPAKA